MPAARTDAIFHAMIIERFPEIQKLTANERVELYCELQDIVVQENELIKPDPEILALLEERHREYLANPESARPASEVMERIRQRVREAKGWMKECAIQETPGA